MVPVRALTAGPTRKYFGVGRGITYYNFTSDQFTGFHAIGIPGTLRDLLYILDGLLDQQTNLRPTELMAEPPATVTSSLVFSGCLGISSACGWLTSGVPVIDGWIRRSLMVSCKTWRCSGLTYA